jgi:hypothetical protein
MAARKDLTPGTRIKVKKLRRRDSTVTEEWITGTVEYLSRDYDGRSWRCLVMYQADDLKVPGMYDGAWLNEVKVIKDS